MEWQLLVVAGLLTAAGAYLGRAAWRTWSGTGCASGCGSCAKSPPPPAEDRRRIALPRV